MGKGMRRRRKEMAIASICPSVSDSAFLRYFFPAKERLAYIAEMKDKLGESEWFKISSKRSVNPDSWTVYNTYVVHTFLQKVQVNQ